MHFKYPEVLYALLLLLIPLIVHLFRLRKFQKEEFTNVKFLKKVTRQTRKSSQIKKWLVLTSRMLLLACVIIAFAQAFLPASQEALESSEKIFYLNNSLSMQATGEQGELLPAAVQNLLENLPKNEEFSLLTNNDEFLNVTLAEIRNDLQDISYSASKFDFNSLEIKAEQIFSQENKENKELVIISDFQQNNGTPELKNEDISYHLIPLQSHSNFNSSIDTVFIEDRNPEHIHLKIGLSSNTESEQQVPLSILNGEKLLAKTSLDFDGKKNTETSLRIRNEPILDGRIIIEDNFLQYDNTLFFSFNANPQIEVVAISEAEDSFLDRIFTEPEFQFTGYSPDQVDYNQLSSANLVVLNELSEVSPALANNLRELQEQGTSLVLIPSEEADISSYLALLQSLNAPVYRTKTEQERLITSISFSHPLLNSVFEEKIQNFEYPKVQSFYSLIPAGSPVLRFQDTPFLVQHNKMFLFASALNSNNSNFKNSPLIVPVFYNIGLNALKVPQLYYKIGDDNQIDVPVSTKKDEVVKIATNENSFIPLQRSFANSVEITMAEFPDNAGNYSILYANENVGNLSFNFSREESELEYTALSGLEHAEIYSSLKEYTETAKAATQINALWKWFVIFALFFLTVEMLLLKYFK